MTAGQEAWTHDASAQPPAPKGRMLRPGGPPGDKTLLIRATPASIDEAIVDIAEDAMESALVYEVERPGGERVALYGVSVFARPPGVPPVEVLRRLASSPYYLEATAGALRAAGLDVLPTGTSPDHFDVLLIDGRPAEEPLLPLTDVRAAAERLVAVCGEARPNPAYPGGSHG